MPQFECFPKRFRINDSLKCIRNIKKSLFGAFFVVLAQTDFLWYYACNITLKGENNADNSYRGAGSILFC